jgi:hypothetical protein
VRTRQGVNLKQITLRRKWRCQLELNLSARVPPSCSIARWLHSRRTTRDREGCPGKGFATLLLISTLGFDAVMKVASERPGNAKGYELPGSNISTVGPNPIMGPEVVFQSSSIEREPSGIYNTTSQSIMN